MSVQLNLTPELSFSDLVIDAGEARAKPAPKKKSVPTYEVALCSGIDFAVRRTCGRSRRLLVCLFSQGQFYVKDEASGAVSLVSRANPKPLAGFMAGSETETLAIGSDSVPSMTFDSDWRNAFVEFISLYNIAETLKSGLYDFAEYFGPRTRRYNRWQCVSYKELAFFVESHPKLARYVGAAVNDAGRGTAESGLLKESCLAFGEVEDVYGLDLARRFVDRYKDSRLASPLPADQMRSLLRAPASRGVYTTYGTYSQRCGAHLVAAYGLDDAVRYDFDRLCGYLFDACAADGYADTADAWVELWADDLRMQVDLTGRVVDKYPENLSSHHDRLAYEARTCKSEVESDRFAVAADAAASFDWAPEGSGLFITHPKSPDEMYAEASMQSNCLASYVGAVSRGESMIFFCRRASDPGQSYLTIELNPVSNRVVQAKARFNREPDEDGLAFVNAWCDRFGLNAGLYRRVSAV